jgi:hypothetical protein
MDMRTLLRSIEPTERERLAKRAKTSVGYLNLIAGGHRKPSPKLARKLVQADNRLTLADLRPDLWQTQEAAA